MKELVLLDKCSSYIFYMPIAGKRLPIIEASVGDNSNGGIDSLATIFASYLHIRPVSVELEPFATCISLE